MAWIRILKKEWMICKTILKATANSEMRQYSFLGNFLKTFLFPFKCARQLNAKKPFVFLLPINTPNYYCYLYIRIGNCKTYSNEKHFGYNRQYTHGAFAADEQE